MRFNRPVCVSTNTEQGGAASKASPKTQKGEERERTAARERKGHGGGGKKTKQKQRRGTRSAEKNDEPERPEKRGVVVGDDGDKSSVHGAAPLGADGDGSGAQSETRSPSSGGRPAAEVESFSLEHIRFENRSKAERDETAGGRTGDGVGTVGGATAAWQASVAAVARNGTAASDLPQKVSGLQAGVGVVLSDV